MGENHQHPRLVTGSDLRSFFHATVFYLANLLTDFSRSEKVFDYTREGPVLRPLAEWYRFAIEAVSPSERKLMLQRLGDVALFISGLFSGYFQRRLVDVDYYIAMGGNAYACLYETNDQSPRDQALAAIFRQLSQQFVQFVNVLAEVGESAYSSSNKQDILGLYEMWAKTGSPRLARKLRDLGVIPQRFGSTH